MSALWDAIDKYADTAHGSLARSLARDEITAELGRMLTEHDDRARRAYAVAASFDEGRARRWKPTRVLPDTCGGCGSCYDNRDAPVPPDAFVCLRGDWRGEVDPSAAPPSLCPLRGKP